MNPLLRMTLALGSAAAAILASAGAAFAAGDTMHHQVEPIAGSSFTCNGTALTGAAGELATDYHVTTAGNGIVRDNGHGTPHDAVLVDQDGNTYRLVGAFTYTDTYDPTTGDTIAGSVSDQLTILGADGSLVGRVGLVEHLYRDGTLRAIQFGSCTDNN